MGTPCCKHAVGLSVAGRVKNRHIAVTSHLTHKSCASKHGMGPDNNVEHATVGLLVVVVVCFCRPLQKTGACLSRFFYCFRSLPHVASDEQKYHRRYSALPCLVQTRTIPHPHPHKKKHCTIITNAITVSLAVSTVYHYFNHTIRSK